MTINDGIVEPTIYNYLNPLVRRLNYILLEVQNVIVIRYYRNFPLSYSLGISTIFYIKRFYLYRINPSVSY